MPRAASSTSAPLPAGGTPTRRAAGPPRASLCRRPARLARPGLHRRLPGARHARQPV